MSAPWRGMTFFSLTLPDRPGELAGFTTQLHKAGVSLLGMWAYAPGLDQPVISCVPASPAAFRRFFRDSGLKIDEGMTFYREGPDTPGVLTETLHRIAKAGINIDAIECVSAEERFGCFIWVSPNEVEKLGRLLGVNGG